MYNNIFLLLDAFVNINKNRPFKTFEKYHAVKDNKIWVCHKNDLVPVSIEILLNISKTENLKTKKVNDTFSIRQRPILIVKMSVLC